MGVIEYVEPEAREWDNPNGPKLYFVDCHLADGSTAGAAFVKESLEAGIASLKAIVGQEVALELEANGEYNGRKKFKLKGWPGKPAGSGGGSGGRSGGGMSHSQAGLLAASNLFAGRGAEAGIPTDTIVAETIRIAEVFTEHLFSRKPPESEKEQETSTVSPPAPAAEDAITLPQMTRLKALADQLKGWKSSDEIAAGLGIDSLGKITRTDADDLIAMWEAELQPTG